MSMYGAYPKVWNTEEKRWEEQIARPTIDCSHDELLTTQADRNEADINKIIARFEKAGMITTLNKNQPFYGDVSEFDGLQDAIIKVQNANELFMDMSAAIRERFDNDPVKMIEFLQDERNRKEAEELGMIVPRPAPPAAGAPSSPGAGPQS